MLSALRGFWQRWVGMTTEVQTVEPAEAPAVPATTPICSADFVAGAATRRLKRTGSSANEAADLKRPRTAPATPIDPMLNGINPPIGKLTTYDPDDPACTRAGGSFTEAGARPVAANSAPAALTRTLRSQPSVSTPPAGTTGPSPSGCGAGSNTQARTHAGAVSGVFAASPTQSQTQTHNQPQLLPHLRQPQQQQHPLAEDTAATGTATGSAGGGGGEENCFSPSRRPTPPPSRGRHPSPTRPHDTHPAAHPSHAHAHSQPHHRHDALEEQVFSPAFHLPSSASSPASSHGGNHSPGPGPGPGSHTITAGGGGGAALCSLGQPSCSGRQLQHHHQQHPPNARQSHVMEHAASGVEAGPGSGSRGTVLDVELHAIDLNVVEGVAVEPKNDEVAIAGGTSSEVGANALVVGRAAGEEATAGRFIAGRATVGVITRAEVEAVEASGMTSYGGTSMQDGEAGKEECYEELDKLGNDENAPLTDRAVSVAEAGYQPSAGPAAALPRLRVHVRITGQPQQKAANEEADNVLVASAPRALAAAVSAATATHAAALATEAVVAEEEGEGEEVEGEEAEEEEDEEAYMEFDPLLFIKQLPPLETCVPANRPPLLPRQTRSLANRKTLVLDLDETLVHSSLEAVDRSDFSFPVIFNAMEHTVYVQQRPHLRDFMVRVAALFEVVVFTASQRIYAERLLDILDPGQELVRHRIYRDSCVVVDGNYLKDLSVLGRDLAHTVIVDNSPQAFGFQVDNGIPIESWYEDDSDTELLKLLPFLESLAPVAVGDVRPRIRQQFRLRELIDRA